MMMALTTRQRDLLQILLDASVPLGSGELADRLNLTARQVSYDLKGLKAWLSDHQVALSMTPGVGVMLTRDAATSLEAVEKLIASTGLKLVLSADLRQQLIATILLTIGEPLIAYNLEQMLAVSRTTTLKDLDVVEAWFHDLSVSLVRRPNYGIWLEAGEHQRRQLIGRLLWGQTPWPQPLVTITHTSGLEFLLETEADLLPAVTYTRDLLSSWEIDRARLQVTSAEAQIGGRYSDDGVIHLALMLAMQAQRVRAGRQIEELDARFSWIQELPVWSIAEHVAAQLAGETHPVWPDGEIAEIAMHLLATPRHERWPGDLEVLESFQTLIDDLLEIAAGAYGIPALSQDIVLRDGLVSHLIPACLRETFRLVMPEVEAAKLPESYETEHAIASAMSALISERLQIQLPAGERENIALLLRAAFIREQPHLSQEVLVVCPSGMATAQLLLARLQARFPRLGRPRVVSLRDLSREAAGPASLVITTVPLPAEISRWADVIRVHPLLLPEDVEAITQWLAR